MKHRYQLTLEVPDTAFPAIQRLKAFLKMALRAWGIRCVGIEEQQGHERCGSSTAAGKFNPGADVPPAALQEHVTARDTF